MSKRLCSPSLVLPLSLVLSSITPLLSELGGLNPYLQYLLIFLVSSLNMAAELTTVRRALVAHIPTVVVTIAQV